MNETLVLEYVHAQVEEKKLNDIRIYIHNKDKNWKVSFYT